MPSQVPKMTGSRADDSTIKKHKNGKSFHFCFLLKCATFKRFLMLALKSQFIANIKYNFFEERQFQSMSESSYSVEQESNSSIKRPYNKVTPEKKEELFMEVFENGMKITKAARKIGLNISTAKFLIKQYRKTHSIFKKAKESTERMQLVSNSTEEDIQPREVNNSTPFPFYYPFYPNGLCPFMAAEPHLLFNPFYHSM